MPSLKKLDLYSHELDDSLLRDGASLHFPVLETLSVKDNDLPPLSAPRLTRFNFSNIWAEPQSVDRLLCLLSNCPLLEELSVQLICDPDAPINHDVVHLPQLRVYTHVEDTMINRLRLWRGRVHKNLGLVQGPAAASCRITTCEI